MIKAIHLMFFIMFSGLTVLISYFPITKVREGAGMSNMSIMRYMMKMIMMIDDVIVAITVVVVITTNVRVRFSTAHD